ncbi:MAG: hypothetical protein IKX97_08440 [Erysipelotrichaceae bacterium]|nr:hypothetical protein [Erysipelotrichaceae bacterium]
MYLIPKKELILDDTENFIFDDYFLILSLIDNGYRYEFDEKYLFIYLKDSLYKLEYSIEDKSDIEETIEDTETINDVSKERTDISSIEDHADTSSSEVQSLSQEYSEQI